MRALVRNRLFLGSLATLGAGVVGHGFLHEAGTTFGIGLGLTLMLLAGASYSLTVGHHEM